MVRTGIAHLDLDDYKNAKPLFVEAARLRLEVKALPETARALRYLGLLYFRDKKFPQALCIWDLAIKIQRGYSDESEQAKLHFFRGRLFVHLKEFCEANPKTDTHRVLTNKVSEALFPSSGERKMLGQIEGTFRDDPRTYRQRRFQPLAYASYRECVRTATNTHLTNWVRDAEAALKQIPVPQL